MEEIVLTRKPTTVIQHKIVVNIFEESSALLNTAARYMPLDFN